MGIRNHRATVVVLLTLWGVASAILVARAYWRVIDEATVDAASGVAAVREEIGDAMAVARQDVVLLARATTGPLARGEVASVAALFAAYAASRAGIAQVRLLDAEGRERIRIEREGDRVRRGDALQDKSDRYYFREAAVMATDEVFVSAVDLNVEHGRVERPLRPTVRVATPVHEQGELRGVVVINLSADRLLAHVARHRELIAGMLLLVDRDGVYISHPDAGQQWGAPSMLGTGRGLASDQPELARWLWHSDATAARRTDGAIVVRAMADPAPNMPRVLLIRATSDALVAGLSGFVPAFVISTASLVVLVVFWLLSARQDRLLADLAREVQQRREVTSREEQLRDAQSRLVASARLAALSASAGALAHELRNPLGAIVNSAGLLYADPRLDRDTRSLMRIIRGEAERLERTVAGFVDLARPSTPCPRRVELSSVVRDVVELARHDATCGEGLALALEVQPDLPPVNIDPDELRQVLWNLLRNAGDATRRAGGGNVAVRVSGGALPVRLEVADEGEGPPTDATHDWPTRGTGLGLIVVAGIVARYGGKFELVSGPNGHGAIARVELPEDRPGTEA